MLMSSSRWRISRMNASAWRRLKGEHHVRHTPVKFWEKLMDGVPFQLTWRIHCNHDNTLTSLACSVDQFVWFFLILINPEEIKMSGSLMIRSCVFTAALETKSREFELHVKVSLVFFSALPSLFSLIQCFFFFSPLHFNQNFSQKLLH